MISASSHLVPPRVGRDGCPSAATLPDICSSFSLAVERIVGVSCWLERLSKPNMDIWLWSGTPPTEEFVLHQHDSDRYLHREQPLRPAEEHTGGLVARLAMYGTPLHGWRVVVKAGGGATR
jgi:hypothetical protein